MRVMKKKEHLNAYIQGNAQEDAPISKDISCDNKTGNKIKIKASGNELERSRKSNEVRRLSIGHGQRRSCAAVMPTCNDGLFNGARKNRFNYPSRASQTEMHRAGHSQSPRVCDRHRDDMNRLSGGAMVKKKSFSQGYRHRGRVRQTAF